MPARIRSATAYATKIPWTLSSFCHSGWSYERCCSRSTRVICLGSKSTFGPSKTQTRGVSGCFLAFYVPVNDCPALFPKTANFSEKISGCNSIEWHRGCSPPPWGLHTGAQKISPPLPLGDLGRPSLVECSICQVSGSLCGPVRSDKVYRCNTY
jgi:hypothetical protein